MYYGQVQHASDTPTNNTAPSSGNARRQSSKKRVVKVEESIKPPVFGRKLHFQGPDNFASDNGKELRRMLRGKYVVLVGDWNMRSVYKDILMHLSQDAECLKVEETNAFGGGIPFEGGLDAVTHHEYHMGWQKPFHAEECRYFETRGTTMVEFVYSYCLFPNLFCQTFAANVGSKNSKIRSPDYLIVGSLIGDMLVCGCDFDAAEMTYLHNTGLVLDFYNEFLSPGGTELIWCTVPALPITWDSGLVLQMPAQCSPVPSKQWKTTLPIKIQMFNHTATNFLLAKGVPIVDVYHLTLKNMESSLNGDGSGMSLGPPAIRFVTHCIMTVVKELKVAGDKAGASVSARPNWIIERVTRKQDGKPSASKKPAREVVKQDVQSHRPPVVELPASNMKKKQPASSTSTDRKAAAKKDEKKSGTASKGDLHISSSKTQSKGHLLNIMPLVSGTVGAADDEAGQGHESIKCVGETTDVEVQHEEIGAYYAERNVIIHESDDEFFVVSKEDMFAAGTSVANGRSEDHIIITPYGGNKHEDGYKDVEEDEVNSWELMPHGPVEALPEDESLDHTNRGQQEADLLVGKFGGFDDDSSVKDVDEAQ